MAWPPTEDDKRRAFEEDGAWFNNHYVCPSCGWDWNDQWSCMCDDNCPICGTTCSPTESEETEFGEEPCRECGVVPGTSEYGTVGDGFDGLCPSCADQAEKADHED